MKTQYDVGPAGSRKKYMVLCRLRPREWSTSLAELAADKLTPPLLQCDETLQRAQRIGT